MNSFIVTSTQDGTLIVRDHATGLTASAATSDEALAELRRLLTAIPIEQERAWNEWIALRDRALETGDIADGIASGKAFGRFHYLFLEPAPKAREAKS